MLNEGIGGPINNGLKTNGHKFVSNLSQDLALVTDAEGLAAGGKEQQQLPMPTKNLFFDGEKLTVWRGR